MEAERRDGVLVPVAAGVLLAAFQIYMVASRGFRPLLETPFLAYCLVGTFAIHFSSRPGRREKLATAALAAAMVAWFVIASGHFTMTWAGTMACAAFPGLASVVVLAVQVVRQRGAEQRTSLDTLIAGSVFSLSALFIATLLHATTTLHPKTYDLYLYSADAGYGFQAAAWAGQFLARRPWLFRTCALAYESLPLMVSLLYAWQRSGDRRMPVNVLPAFIGGGIAAYALYNLLPACGPYYVFGKAYPFGLPDAAKLVPQLLVMGAAARNAVPSMHFACALLIWWTCRPLPRVVRLGAVLYMALTVLATLGFGEHYLVDLVAGVPYALAVRGACAAAGTRGRRAALVGGVGMTLAWLLALRFLTPVFHSGIFTWTASLATLAAVALLTIEMRESQATVDRARDSE